MSMEFMNRFGTSDLEAFMPEEKIALLASTDPEGLPHITLITSMRGAGPTRLTLGEFCKGRSKAYIRERPNVGFLIMTLDRKLWRGRAVWTHSRQDGPEFEAYNDMPMFRYNSYFGINTVHYMDLVGYSGPKKLPLSKIIRSTLKTRMARGAQRDDAYERVLQPFSEQLFKRMDTLKFLAYVKPDGFPCIIPLLQCQAPNSRRLVFDIGPWNTDLVRIPEHTPLAVFGLTMAMEDVLVRGTYRGVRKSRGIRLGVLDLNWVYNSMPPCHGQIYPEVPLEAVTIFD